MQLSSRLNFWLTYRGKKGASDHLKKLAHDNTVLTNDEIKLVVETCVMLSNMSLGIDKDTCIQVCNKILSQQIETKDFLPVTKEVVGRIIRKKQGLTQADLWELH